MKLFLFMILNKKKINYLKTDFRFYKTLMINLYQFNKKKKF